MVTDLRTKKVSKGLVQDDPSFQSGSDVPVPLTPENKRIAKNTILLYVRTILVMVVSLYTSRVVLNTLGVEDYGVYQVVGGVVGMFSIISGALTNAISRFLTFGLGKGDIKKLKKIFSTSIIVQIVIAVVILILCEVVGLWFLENKLDIPDGRMEAGTWVLHCSLVVFVVNLISVPYNASIIAHEKMDVFAYISILDVVLKLVIVYLLLISPFDKLVSYAILSVIVATIIRIIYGIYCGRKFAECKGRLIYDRGIFKEMLGFAGWNFFSNVILVFNNQGVNMLINMYFGVSMNAARGIASQVESSVQQFANNFTTAINPQITKSYAAKENERLYYLICKGAKFSFLLLFCICLPILTETDYLLLIWLKTVPAKTALFTRLAFISAMVGILGNSCYTACLATGKIKIYTIWVSIISAAVFFLTWICYKLGGNVEFTYYIYIVDWLILLIAKLYLTKSLIGFQPSRFYKEVIGRIIPVVICSVILPIVVTMVFPQSIWRLLLSCAVCVISSCLSIYLIGFSFGERELVNGKIKIFINKIFK